MNIRYYLLIFQLEAYRTMRFIKWIVTHYAPFEEHEDKEPVWTTKAKLIYSFTLVLYVLTGLVILCTFSWFVFVFLMVFLWLHIFIFMPLALMLLLPYEITNRLRVKYFIQNKVAGLKKTANLTVIGITGSYGKTSTKLVLHELLPKTLVTAKSFNTLFGIYKVVDYELNNHYRYFVCEMGAYKRGDVKEFCDLVKPNIGVLTGINEQHLERFGSIENTIKAKFEVLTNTVPGGIGVANLDNERIRENFQQFKQRLDKSKLKLIGYSTDGHTSEYCHEILAIKSWRIENNKSVCQIDHQDKTYNLVTPLIGRGHLSNILAGIAVSLACGEDINNVLERASKLKQIPHRLELRTMPGLTILDDTYSSNPSGFREALDTLSLFEGHKVLITPGIVELGERAIEIHQEIGTLAAKICDEIVLVGNSKNMEAMQESILATGYLTDKITRLPNRDSAQELLRSRSGSQQIILMENDLPDQYL